MKKTLLFIITALIAYAGNTQTSGNTSIPIKDLQDGLFVIRVLKDRTVLLQEKIDSLYKRIELKEANEIDYEQKALNLQAEIDMLRTQKAGLDGQVAILQRAYDDATKKYKRQKRKTVFVGIAGALTTVAAIFLIK
jgi:hypothetical protein